MKIIFKLVIIIVIYSFLSCKKQVDTLSPVITMTSPSENNQFMVNDQIHVISNICDDHRLEYVDISLTDQNFVTAIHGTTIYPENNCYELNYFLKIDNIFLPSGYYYLLVKASDGITETRKFVKIYISTVPKKLQYLLVITKNNNLIKVNKLDSTFNTSNILTLSSDYCGSAYCSDAGLFYIAGKYSGDINVYGSDDWNLRWSVPAVFNPPFPSFEAICIKNKQLYVSYRHGKFEIYDQYGHIKAQKNTEDGNYVARFFPMDDYLFTFEKNQNSMVKNMLVYFVPSYALQQKLIVNHELQNLMYLNDNEYLVLCNHVNYYSIKKYYVSSHSFDNLTTYPIGNVNSSGWLYNNIYLYTTESTVSNFNLSDLNGNVIFAGQNLNNLVIDNTNYTYYFSENYHTIKKFQYPFYFIGESDAFQDTIVNILPVYNKN